MWMRRLAAVPGPLRVATASKSSDVVSINLRARSTRCAVIQSSGVHPSSERNRRCAQYDDQDAIRVLGHDLVGESGAKNPGHNGCLNP
jgi:hypothetical protein